MFDVILLQETHSTKNVEKRWKTEFGGQIIFNHGVNNACGVSIMLSCRVVTKVHSTIKSFQGRFLILDIEINDIRYMISNFYAPNKDTPEFFTEPFENTMHFENDYMLIQYSSD